MVENLNSCANQIPCRFTLLQCVFYYHITMHAVVSSTVNQASEASLTGSSLGKSLRVKDTKRADGKDSKIS